MKNICLLFGFITTLATAQCTINGKSSISIHTEENYTLSEDAAQCKECHLWQVAGDNAVIMGDARQNSTKLKAEKGGRQVLTATLLTPQGIVQCSKAIDLLDPAATSTPADPGCDIGLTTYKEAKSAEQIATFFPNVADNNFKYSWTAAYTTGETLSSRDKTPRFPFSKDSGITTVTLQVTSQKCMKTISKTYDANFWKFF